MLKQSIAGIDVSADKLDVAAEFDQARRNTETFENNASGHMKLCQWVTRASRAARVVVVRRRRRIANRYRREALDALAVIESDVRVREVRAEALARLPELLKRVALSAVSRADVASLTGERWLSFLDTGYDGDGFTRGPGRLLPTLAYRSSDSLEAISHQEACDLVELARLWIGSHDLAGH